MEQQSSKLGLALISNALSLAAELHRKQMRKDGESPYINHPITVMNILAQHGLNDPNLIAAALLHDVIEDCSKDFGGPARVEHLIMGHTNLVVLKLVREVSDDMRLTSRERKDSQLLNVLNLSKEARMLRIADKTANMYDTCKRKPTDWSDSLVLTYAAWGLQVVDRIRGTHFGLEATFDRLQAKVVEKYSGGSTTTEG